MRDPTRPQRLGPPLTGHTGPVVSVAFAPDGHTLATGSARPSVILWDVRDPARPQRLGPPLTGHTDAVCTRWRSPRTGTPWPPAATTSVILWDVRDPARPQRIGSHSRPRHTRPVVWSVAFAPDGHTLATGSGDSR